MLAPQYSYPCRPEFRFLWRRVKTKKKKKTHDGTKLMKDTISSAWMVEVVTHSTIFGSTRDAR
jgi:hypothetical protein